MITLLDALIDQLADAVADRIAKRQPTTNAKALTRRAFAQLIGVGRTKLAALIANGTVKTLRDDPRLIATTEADKFTQSRRQKPRRAVRPITPQSGTTSATATRARLAELIRRGRT